MEVPHPETEPEKTPTMECSQYACLMMFSTISGMPFSFRLSSKNWPHLTLPLCASWQGWWGGQGGVWESVWGSGARSGPASL